MLSLGCRQPEEGHYRQESRQERTHRTSAVLCSLMPCHPIGAPMVPHAHAHAHVHVHVHAHVHVPTYHVITPG